MNKTAEGSFLSAFDRTQKLVLTAAINMMQQVKSDLLVVCIEFELSIVGVIEGNLNGLGLVEGTLDVQRVHRVENQQVDL